MIWSCIIFHAFVYAAGLIIFYLFPIELSPQFNGPQVLTYNVNTNAVSDGISGLEITGGNLNSGTKNTVLMVQPSSSVIENNRIATTNQFISRSNLVHINAINSIDKNRSFNSEDHREFLTNIYDHGKDHNGS